MADSANRVARKQVPFIVRWRSAVLAARPTREQLRENPNVIWEPGARLTSTEKVVLLALAESANSAGRSCFPAITLVARRANVTDKTAGHWLDSAGRKGWFEREKRGTGKDWKHFEYVLKIPDGAVEVTAPNDLDGAVATTPRNSDGAANDANLGVVFHA